MPRLHGYHHRCRHVDLSGRSSTVFELADRDLSEWIGGTGLGTWLLNRHCAEMADPLAPDAPLLFVFSPLVGSPVTTSAKFAVVAKSPLTQRLNDSLSSSSFAIAGKRCGMDALIITGRATEWLCVVIDDDDVRFEPVPHLVGRSSRQTEAAIENETDRGFRVASIGVAGERLVRYATISNEGRHAGRGGHGAVMGAKQLKAIAVRGSRQIEFAHPADLVRYSRRLSELSLGPATAKYRELGTVSNLLTFNRLGTLPVRNFQAGQIEHVAQLSMESVPHAGRPRSPTPQVQAGRQRQTSAASRTRASCAACTIGCEHIFHRDPGRIDADHSDAESGVRMEYENLFALGPLCGITDQDTVLQASQLCDELGIDTISTGATIAFAMECAERGLIDEPALRFGNGSALLASILSIGTRAGIGDLLAEGSRIAAEHIGQGSRDFAPHVKGLELPGYEPRGLQTMALGFAVGSRGADHNRSGAYQADFSDRVDRLAIDESAVPLAIETEDESVLMDSLILCRFLRGVFDDRFAAMAEMLRLTTGREWTVSELRRTAGRIVTARKQFNIRQGWTPEEDTLPPRVLSEPLINPDGSSVRLNRDRLQQAIHAYNLARGWTADGWCD